MSLISGGLTLNGMGYIVRLDAKRKGGGGYSPKKTVKITLNLCVQSKVGYIQLSAKF